MNSINKKWVYYSPNFEYEQKLQDMEWGWAGHKYFAYDLVRHIKPKKIVELGTERGTSFFSMCQAVKDGKLNSTLYAIDSWKGDKHTGPYDEATFNNFNKHKQLYYSKLNIVVKREFFDKAVSDFEKSSIDLLHIDGLHTLKAVKHDFELWFDKVKPNGIILLHDTNEMKKGFGVYKFWKILKKKYKTIEFLHSHGLGILFKGSDFYSEFIKNEDFWKRYYFVLYEYNLFQKVNLNSEIMKSREDIKRLEYELNNYKEILRKIESAKFFRFWQSYCHFRDSLFGFNKKIK